MSKHTKLTPEAHTQAVALARNGIPKTVIADALRIDRDSILEWLDRGQREPGSIFEAFRLDFNAARAEYQIAALARVNIGGDDWRPLAWSLERIFPKTFGNRQAVELTGKDGGPIDQRHTHTLDADTLCDRIGALAAELTRGAGCLDAPAGAAGDEPGGTGGGRAPDGAAGG